MFNFLFTFFRKKNKAKVKLHFRKKPVSSMQRPRKNILPQPYLKSKSDQFLQIVKIYSKSSKWFVFLFETDNTLLLKLKGYSIVLKKELYVW